MTESEPTLWTRCPEIVDFETKRTCGAMAKVALGSIFEGTDGFVYFATTECENEHRLNGPTSMLGDFITEEESAA